MRIVASQVALSAETSVTHSTTESATGRLWIGDRGATDRVQVSDAARSKMMVGASQQNEGTNVEDSKITKPTATDNSDEELLGSPEGARFVVLRRLLEAMTGKKIRLARPEDSKLSETDQQAIEQLANSAQPTAAATSGNERAGWGLELDIERQHVETTSVNFAAQGTIVTEDGKSIAFDAAFVKLSSSITVEKLSLREGDATMKDPLVLLYSGTHAELLQQAQAFDLDANGTLEQLPSLGNGAYVAQDLNKNGKIDDGKELLGAISGDGFADLRAMDQDGNGFIDSGDARFSELYLWEPGQNGTGKLTSLADARLLGLYTGNVSTPLDLQGQTAELVGRVKTTGIYVTEDGTVRPMEQIDVKV
jgi:hypothetical protein